MYDTHTRANLYGLPMELSVEDLLNLADLEDAVLFDMMGEYVETYEADKMREDEPDMCDEPDMMCEVVCSNLVVSGCW